MVISDGIHQSHEPAPAPLNPATRRRLHWYLLPLLAGPLLLLAVAFALIPSQHFTRLGGDEWLIGMGYGASLRQVNCQVVVFGDSSAEVGVNPAEIERRTGLSTCNIGENAGLIALEGTAVLDQYLKQNAPPKYLIFFFAPEDFDLQAPKAVEEHGQYEAITYRLRQPHKLASLALIMRHPRNIFRWVSTGLDSYLRNVRGKRLSDDTMYQRERTHGQLSILDPTLTTCTEAPVNRNPSKAWIDGLRTQYTRNGTTVLVDAMPLPNCDPSLSFYSPKLSGLVDNPDVTFPVNVYVFGGRHVNATGSMLLSEMLSMQLNCLQQHTPTRLR